MWEGQSVCVFGKEKLKEQGNSENFSIVPC